MKYYGNSIVLFANLKIALIFLLLAALQFVADLFNKRNCSNRLFCFLETKIEVLKLKQ